MSISTLIITGMATFILGVWCGFAAAGKLMGKVIANLKKEGLIYARTSNPHREPLQV